MTDEKKNKSKPLKEFALAAQERLRNMKPQRQQKFNKPTNFRPQGRGR